MVIAPFLAMTAVEMYTSSSLPPKIAWMACHFSPYALGLSNLPRTLPPDSLLIVDDCTPPQGHDPEFIVRQLSECVEQLGCCGVLLDFQRTGSQQSANIAKMVAQTLSCPVAVSESYAEGLRCPVLLPPLPPSSLLEEQLRIWEGREVWLELGLDGEIITLEEQGAKTVALPCPELSPSGFEEKNLHCHYSIQTKEKSASFTLWRTKDDITALLAKAAALGVTQAVGLYQELQTG